MDFGRLAVFLFVFSLFVLPVSASLFSLGFPSHKLFYLAGDVNGTDLNINNVWINEAHILHLFASDVNGMELDGGFANSVYLVSQYWDGGPA